MTNCRRCFKSVEFDSYIFSDLHYDGVYALLTNIGHAVKELNFRWGVIGLDDLCQLLSLVPNVEVLDILELETFDPEKNSLTISHKFEKLKKLRLFDVDPAHAAYYSHIFKDLTSLRELEINEAFEILARQTKLKKLHLVPTNNFNALPVNEELQVIDLDMKITCYSELNLWAMQNLEDFLKTQKKIESYVLSIESENNFNGILTHILNLESLRTLVVAEAKTDDSLLRFIRNDNVQKIVMKAKYSELINLAQFVRSFPKTKSLHLRDISREDNPLINSFKFLEELVIRYSCQFFQRLEGLQLPNLKRLEINSFEKKTPENFKTIFTRFIENHSQIEELKLNIFSPVSMMDLEDFKVVLENLKDLKKLSIYIKFDNFQNTIFEICKLIKKHAKNLNNLELQFRGMKNFGTIKTKVKDFFQRVLPNLKVDLVSWKSLFSFS